jgi:Zn-dependent protease/CBS domain-containing protein
MIGKKIPLFKLFGFQINIDLSWFFIVILVTWTLAAGYFPERFEDLPEATYWTMGVIGALGLFASIVLHELAHSLVARRFDIDMHGITLFVFGGVAEMRDEPKSAKAEFLVAIAGPIASLILAGMAWGVYEMAAAFEWYPPVRGVAGYLVFMNLAVVIFNLIPAFPLDGGRVLRSAIWQYDGNVRRATRITSDMGRGFGIGLIALGVLSLLSGNLIGGIWWCLIGLFLRGAANMSYQQLITRRALEGERVERFMTPDPIAVPHEISVESLVNDFVYRHHHKLFPVQDNGALTGCVGIDDIKSIPQEDWPSTPVRAIAQPCSDDNTIDAGADALHALEAMNRQSKSRMLVLRDGALAGVITLKDLLEFLALKVELEDGTRS